MTDRELAAQAEAAFKATTITYPDWKRRVDQGKYPDVTVTKWWQGFDALSKIDQTPPVQFGEDLFEGFEWAEQEITGSIARPTTNQELQLALSSAADIVDGGGRTFTNPGQLVLPTHSGFRMLLNTKVSGARVYRQGGNWRLRDCDIGYGAPEDSVKAENAGKLDIDGCRIHHAPKQGILLYADDVVIRNSRVYDNGTIDLSNQHHGIYASKGNRLLTFSTAYYGSTAYQMQLYPQYHGIRGVCLTVYGGKTRGGIVVGSENTNPTSDVRLIGVVSTNAPWYGFDQWQQAFRISIEDCLGWQNTKGDVTASLQGSLVRFVHGDPKFKNAASGDFSLLAGSAAKGIIDPSLWKYVPPTDINGNPRVTADAGAWAA